MQTTMKVSKAVVAIDGGPTVNVPEVTINIDVVAVPDLSILAPGLTNLEFQVALPCFVQSGTRGSLCIDGLDATIPVILASFGFNNVADFVSTGAPVAQDGSYMDAERFAKRMGELAESVSPDVVVHGV